MRELLSNDLADSADKLCNLVLSTSDGLPPKDCSSMLELHGDSIFATKDFRRALQLYRQASLPPSTQPQPLQAGGADKRPPISTTRDATLRLKECQCHIKLEESTIALRELEAIPVELRDVQVNVCLGRLYKNAGLRRHAVTTLQLVVQSCPLAIECLEMLAALGVKQTDLPPPVDQGTSGVDFLPLLTKSVCSASAPAGQDGRLPDVEAFSSAFPNSSYALTQLAVSAFECDKLDEAVEAFSKVRRLDRYSHQGMELFCRELYARRDLLELSKLATDMLHRNTCDAQSAVGWMAAGMYCQLKGELEQAMSFLDKACKADPRSCATFNAKGYLFLQRGKPEQASISFSQANAIQKNVDAYAGLVEANLVLSKFNHALSAAKCALKMRPTSSQCFTLLGSVIMKSDSPNGRKEATLVFKKALKLNPCNAEAAIGLSEVLCEEDAHEQACACLKEALEAKPSYDLRCKYGKLLGQLGRHDEAIQQLHIAMSSAPTADLSEALGEMEVLEGSMRGGEEEQNECEQFEEHDYDDLSGLMEGAGHNDIWERMRESDDSPQSLGYSSGGI